MIKLTIILYSARFEVLYMSVETLKKRTCSIKLENGTDSSGNVRYVSLNIGSLNASRWDGDKALAIVGALESCLNKTIGFVEPTATYTLSPS